MLGTSFENAVVKQVAQAMAWWWTQLHSRFSKWIKMVFIFIIYCTPHKDMWVRDAGDLQRTNLRNQCLERSSVHVVWLSPSNIMHRLCVCLMHFLQLAFWPNSERRQQHFVIGTSLTPKKWTIIFNTLLLKIFWCFTFFWTPTHIECRSLVSVMFLRSNAPVSGASMPVLMFFFFFRLPSQIFVCFCCWMFTLPQKKGEDEAILNLNRWYSGAIFTFLMEVFFQLPCVFLVNLHSRIFGTRNDLTPKKIAAEFGLGVLLKSHRLGWIGHF